MASPASTPVVFYAAANAANVAALIWQVVPDLNWAGFYRMVESELVLGPFQGKAACNGWTYWHFDAQGALKLNVLCFDQEL